MWRLPSGMILPLHICHLKHTVWNKEELPLTTAVCPCDIVDMHTPPLWVDLHNIEHRRLPTECFCAIAECALTECPVCGGGEEHRDTVHSPHSEEETVLIRQSAPTVQLEVHGPIHRQSLHLSHDCEAVDATHNGCHIGGYGGVIHSDRFIQNAAELATAQLEGGCPQTLAGSRHFRQQLILVVECFCLKLLGKGTQER
jgi:hypothetical protein